MTIKNFDEDIEALLQKAFGPGEALGKWARQRSVLHQHLTGLLVPVSHFPDSPCPVLVQGDSFVPPSDGWQRLLEAARPRLEPSLPCVGRLESVERSSKGESSMTQQGTAWLVADDVAVTNRHTLPHNILDRFTAGEIELRLDLLGEYGSKATRHRAIREVLYIAPDHDLAFVLLADEGPSIRLAKRLDPSHALCAVGFPRRPKVGASPEQLRCYPETDGQGVKRLAPGNLRGVTAREIEFDCSTLSGSSGSVLLDLETGEAVGLCLGSNTEENVNEAVPSWIVAERLRRLDH